MSDLALSAPAASPARDEVGTEVVTFAVDATSAVRLLAGLRALALTALPATPSIDAIFDVLERVLGEHAVIAPGDVGVLERQLHAVFRSLVYLSRTPGSGMNEDLVAASRNFMTDLMPRDLPGARSHLRRLALTVSDLLDQLLEDMP